MKSDKIKNEKMMRKYENEKPVASGSNALNLSKIIALLFMIKPCNDVLFTTSILYIIIHFLFKFEEIGIEIF